MNTSFLKFNFYLIVMLIWVIFFIIKNNIYILEFDFYNLEIMLYLKIKYKKNYECHLRNYFTIYLKT